MVENSLIPRLHCVKAQVSILIHCAKYTAGADLGGVMGIG